MTSNILRIIMRFIVIIGMILLLSSILLEMIPVFTDGSKEVVNAIHLTNQQYALAERIDKDVLILAYRPEAEHASAILELQVTLPHWEQVQSGLQTSDPTLQLPAHVPGDVQLLLIQAQPDYTAIDSAARSILANTDPPVDPNELAIVQQHERPYFLEMSTVSKIWEGHMEQNATAFFQLELWFGVGLLVLLIAYWIPGRVIHNRALKKEGIGAARQGNRNVV